MTPLSSAGLWLAVTITPIHCPLSFFERRPARRPTAKTTVLRRSLRHGFGQQASTSTNGRSRGAFVWRRGRSILSKTYAFMRNYRRKSISVSWRSSRKVLRAARHTPAVPYWKTLPSGFEYCRAASLIAFLTAGEAIVARQAAIKVEVGEIGSKSRRQAMNVHRGRLEGEKEGGSTLKQKRNEGLGVRNGLNATPLSSLAVSQSRGIPPPRRVPGCGNKILPATSAVEITGSLTKPYDQQGGEPSSTMIIISNRSPGLQSAIVHETKYPRANLPTIF